LNVRELVLISMLIALLVIPIGLGYAQTSYVINIPTGAADPNAPYFWQVESTGNTDGVLTVEVSDTVIWENADTEFHTVTSGTEEEGPDEIFDSGLFGPGKDFSFQFTEVGDYHYYCTEHPWMVGVITVRAEEDDQDKGPIDDVDESASAMLSDGTEVLVYAGVPTADEVMEITIEFVDSENTIYDVMITQNGETVLDETGVHEHDGIGTHETAELSSADPVDVTITFQGFGLPDDESNWTGPIGEVVTFTNVVPEFGPLAGIVFVISIVAIIVITTKTQKFGMPKL